MLGPSEGEFRSVKRLEVCECWFPPGCSSDFNYFVIEHFLATYFVSCSSIHRKEDESKTGQAGLCMWTWILTGLASHYTWLHLCSYRLSVVTRHFHASLPLMDSLIPRSTSTSRLAASAHASRFIRAAPYCSLIHHGQYLPIS